MSTRREGNIVRYAAAAALAIGLASFPTHARAQVTSAQRVLDDVEPIGSSDATLEAARFLVRQAAGQPSAVRAPAFVRAAQALLRAGAPDVEVRELLHRVYAEPTGDGPPYEVREARRHAFAIEFEMALARSDVGTALGLGEAFAAVRGPDWLPWVLPELRRLASLHLSEGHTERGVVLARRVVRARPVELATAEWLVTFIARLSDREQLAALETSIIRHPARSWDSSPHRESVLAAIHLRVAALAREHGDGVTANTERETAGRIAARGSLPYDVISEGIAAVDLAGFERLLADAQRSLSCDAHGRIAATGIDAIESTLAHAAALRGQIAWFENAALDHHAFLRDEAVRLAAASTLATSATGCAIAPDPRWIARIEQMEREADRLEATDARRADSLRIDAALERERNRERAVAVDPIAASFEERERVRIRQLVASGRELAMGVRDATASPSMAAFEARALARWSEVR